MKLEIILQVISLLISGFIGYMIKDFLSKKSEKETRLFERKEKRYKEIFGLLINFYREKE